MDSRDPGTTADPRSPAARIVASLTTQQCIELVSGRDLWTTVPIPGVVPSVLMTDGPNGVRKQVGAFDNLGVHDALPATCMPTTAVLASTWDVALVERVGAALGREARAADVALLLAPGLNLKRHPRGGRGFEYFSEDPVLSGHLAAAFVRGVQGQGVGACVKHFAANNQETMRMVIDTVVDERTLRELYLRGFEIALDRGRPAAVMSAYNRLNGTYCGEDRWLLHDVLRGEWGFDGLVVSDWFAVDDRVAGLRAGLDLEMPGRSGAHDRRIAAALADGSLAESDLRASATRVVALALRWPSGDDGDVEPVDFDAHHLLAREVAAAGTVLLANDGLLPLGDASGVALIGAFAESARFQGGGSARVTPTRVDTLREALGTDLAYARGYDPATGEVTPGDRALALAAAEQADRVVLVVGFPARYETEGIDRPSTRLPDGMEQLVVDVCAANPRTVVVLVNSGPLELDWADRPAALVEAYLAGQAGGSALADVLLGRAEPTGRLAESFPAAIADLPADSNFPGQSRAVQYREGPWVGYRFHSTFDVPARFPFGHGLGYTTWRLGQLEVAGTGIQRTAHVTVTNTGSRAGTTVAQVYLRAEAPTLARPDRELAGFARVRLGAGESTRVAIELEPRVFAVWDVRASRWAVEAGRYQVLVGTSSVEVHDRAVVTVDSGDVVTAVARPAGPVATDAEFAALLGRPLPEPEPARPFTRNSTLAEVATSRVGGVLVALARRQVERLVPADDDGSARAMLESALTGVPLRVIAAMGGGLTPGTVDRLVALLNGDLVRAIRGR